MSKQSIIPEVAAEAANRRSFVKKLGVASAVATAAALTEGSAKAAMPPNDIDILNFALNLEYLEAEFYSVATVGKTIDQLGIPIDGIGTPGMTTGGHQVNVTDHALFTREIAFQLARDERDHVNVLRSALGSAAIAKPAINLDALGFGFDTQADFLSLSRIFEDIGITAYAGAAPLLTDPFVIGLAALILAVEALHSGNIRLQVARFGIQTTPVDGRDFVPPPTGSRFFPVYLPSSLVEVRDPGQVLYLAYGNQANATSGGFFPNGVNGTLNTSSTEALIAVH